MAKSTKSAEIRKLTNGYDGKPPFAHASGRWAKKCFGKLRFFGRWGRKDGKRVVPVEDVPASLEAAKAELARQWPYLKDGRVPPAPVTPGTASVDTPILRVLCNRFLTVKTRRVEGGERSARTLAGYRRATDLVMDAFGGERRLDDISVADFEALRNRLARGRHPTSLGNDIRHIRILFKFAYDVELMDRPMRYGPDFRPPERAVIRKAEQRHAKDHGKRLFAADELRRMLDALDGTAVDVDGESVTLPPSPTMKAMILLGVNCGFGQTDVANLELSHLDLRAGWADYPREKTAVPRRCPLWPETVAALEAAIKVRPAPKNEADAGCVFLSRYRRRCVTVSPKGGVTDTVGAGFSRLLNTLGLKRKRLAFYALRHVTETIGGGAKDQVALDLIMGHLDPSMADRYREGFDDGRLLAVSEHIRKWLFDESAE